MPTLFLKSIQIILYFLISIYSYCVCKFRINDFTYLDTITKHYFDLLFNFYVSYLFYTYNVTVIKEHLFLRNSDS